MKEYIGEYRDAIRKKSREWIAKKRAFNKLASKKCATCKVKMRRIGSTATFECPLCGELEVVDDIVITDDHIFGNKGKWLKRDITKKYKGESPIN